MPTSSPSPAAATVTPTAAPSPEPTVVPSVTAVQQSIIDGAVVIARVVSNGPGWVTVHTDADGQPGDVLGYQAIPSGVSVDVRIAIDVSRATPTLYAVLHHDEGQDGVFEYPDGPDVPVEVGGMLVMTAFAIEVPQQTVALQLVAEGLTSPIALVSPRDGSGRLFIADQIGVVRVLQADGQLVEAPFLDLRSRMIGLSPGYDERGLLGLALHPQFEQNGRLFVYYSAPRRSNAPSDWNHTSHVSEFRVSTQDANRADAGSEKIILQIDQPQPNHNGGQLAFGADGFLYIPLGDGGGANDTGMGHGPQGNGQDLSTWLGKILRIDVDRGAPYAIPPDNPFVGQDARPEIYAYGLRNPFRISFDAGGQHDLFAGDAGQSQWEEIDLIQKGGNYGWRIKEGRHCFDPENPRSSPTDCPDVGARGEPLIDPIVEYPNASAPGGFGRSAIAGYVYRGRAIPGLQGQFIFGDWSTSFVPGSGTLFVARPPAGVAQQAWSFQRLPIAGREDGQVGAYVLSFGQDDENELYVLTTRSPGPSLSAGRIFKLVPVP